MTNQTFSTKCSVCKISWRSWRNVLCKFKLFCYITWFSGLRTYIIRSNQQIFCYYHPKDQSISGWTRIWKQIVCSQVLSLMYYVFSWGADFGCNKSWKIEEVFAKGWRDIKVKYAITREYPRLNWILTATSGVVCDLQVRGWK